MDWLLANWFWILILVLLIAMHLFGHGGHSGGNLIVNETRMQEKKTKGKVAS